MSVTSASTQIHANNHMSFKIAELPPDCLRKTFSFIQNDYNKIILTCSLFYNTIHLKEKDTEARLKYCGSLKGCLMLSQSDPRPIVLKIFLREINNRWRPSRKKISDALVDLVQLDKKDNNLTMLVVATIDRKLPLIKSHPDNYRKRVYRSLLQHWSGQNTSFLDFYTFPSTHEQVEWLKDSRSSLSSNPECTDHFLEKVKRFWSTCFRVEKEKGVLDLDKANGYYLSSKERASAMSELREAKQAMKEAKDLIAESVIPHQNK